MSCFVIINKTKIDINQTNRKYKQNVYYTININIHTYEIVFCMCIFILNVYVDDVHTHMYINVCHIKVKYSIWQKFLYTKISQSTKIK